MYGLKLFFVYNFQSKLGCNLQDFVHVLLASLVKKCHEHPRISYCLLTFDFVAKSLIKKLSKCMIGSNLFGFRKSHLILVLIYKTNRRQKVSVYMLQFGSDHSYGNLKISLTCVCVERKFVAC